MLAYAFSALRSKGNASLESEEFGNIDDLFAAILTRGIAQQVKRGLKREYIEEEQVLSVPRGKIDVSATIKTNSMIQHKIVCNIDEYSANAYLNRILKTAGLRLLKSDADKTRKKELRRVLAYLHDVEPLDPRNIQWKQHYVRQDQTYRMLVSVSRLVMDRHIHGSNEGELRLEQFDEEHMPRLFERFVLEYFRQEHGDKVSANASLIPWVLDDNYNELLPTMRSDIILTPKDPNSNSVLIIDTKYYTDNLQHRFARDKVKSDHLYQIFTYVKNKQAQLHREETPKVVSGMLLYAKTDAETQPDANYQMSGNQISVRTLDLEADFVEIRMQLDEILTQVIARRALSAELATGISNEAT